MDMRNDAVLHEAYKILENKLSRYPKAIPARERKEKAMERLKDFKRF